MTKRRCSACSASPASAAPRSSPRKTGPSNERRGRHPAGNPQAEAKFKEINEAYDVIGNPGKRHEYDNRRSSAGNGWAFNMNGMPGGLDDFINQFFNQHGFGNARQSQPKNRDVTLSLTINLEDAYAGKNIPVQYGTPSGRKVDFKNTLIIMTSNIGVRQLKEFGDGVGFATKTKIDRLIHHPSKLDSTLDPLSEKQQEALDAVKAQLKTKPVGLLHGVTGSGKTQIYASLIQQEVQQGKQALYMLPEIALTAQMIRRLQQYFGGSVAIYHSKFNPNERVEIWNKVKTGEIKIVLGARSALFLPYKNLSLIVIDEEHDPSYKQQEPAPRYQARDTAIYYASQLKAKVVLGSATPSVETYFNATTKKYGYTYLEQRFGVGTLPKIELIDTKKQPHHQLILTPPLLAAISKTIANKKQVILFQNRRGYAAYLICDTCGWIPHCEHCDVTLTYHKAKHLLSCHYCGASYPIVSICKACGKQSFKQKSFGTEQIEEKLTQALPGVMVARMDLDNVKGKNEHDRLIQKFEQKQIDILVGTQMVVKGLDFENVDLVGIVDADSLLNFNQYRVNERAFQMMEQVSGRAGRKNENGTVMIQVSQWSHPIIQLVQQHDYFGFYKFEIQNRKNFAYPPYSRLMSLLFKHTENHLAEEAANHFLHTLTPEIQKSVLGPAQPIVNRVRNKYIWELAIKMSTQSNALQMAKKQLLHYIRLLEVHPRYKSVNIVIDIDPN